MGRAEGWDGPFPTIDRRHSFTLTQERRQEERINASDKKRGACHRMSLSCCTAIPSKCVFFKRVRWLDWPWVDFRVAVCFGSNFPSFPSGQKTRGSLDRSNSRREILGIIRKIGSVFKRRPRPQEQRSESVIVGLGVIGAFFRNPLIRSANQRPRSALGGRSRGHFPSLLDRPLPVKSHWLLRTGFPQVATQSSKDFHRMASKSARFPASTQSLRTTCPPWRTSRPAASSSETCRCSGSPKTGAGEALETDK